MPKKLHLLAILIPDSYNTIVDAWYRGNRVDADKIGLAWFQHKVPNSQSFPAAIANGSVFDANGVSQRTPRFILVPHITEVYKCDARRERNTG